MAAEPAKPDDWRPLSGAKAFIRDCTNDVAPHDERGRPLCCDVPGCKSSTKVFKRWYELDRHKKKHFPEEIFSCFVIGCSQSKKGKTWCRRDKFREHLDSHGENPSMVCPILHCDAKLLKADFREHVATQHIILERCLVKTILEMMKIDFQRGWWHCPMVCDFKFFYNSFRSSQDILEDHLKSHDLMEASMFINSLSLMQIILWGNTLTCPICSQKLPDNNGHRTIESHIETEHSDTELSNHGPMLAKLCGLYLNSFRVDKYPRLFGVVRKHLLTTNAFSSFICNTSQSNSSGSLSPSRKVYSLSSEPWFLSVADHTAIRRDVPPDQRRPLPTFTLETAKEALSSLNSSDRPTGQMPTASSSMVPTPDESHKWPAQPLEGSDVQHFGLQAKGASMNANSFACAREGSDLWQLPSTDCYNQTSSGWWSTQQDLSNAAAAAPSWTGSTTFSMGNPSYARAERRKFSDYTPQTNDISAAWQLPQLPDFEMVDDTHRAV